MPPDPRYADCVEVIEHDDDDDGTTNARETIHYDDAGNRTLHTTDHDADGQTDTTAEYVYDLNGRLVSISRYPGGSAVPNWIDTLEYNTDGKLERWVADTDGDGRPNRITTYAYDALGRLVREAMDSDADGIENKVISYTYDNGRLVREETDTDMDGVPNIVYEYAWNDDLLVRRETSISDRLTNVERFYYDEEGRLVRRELDYDDNPDDDPDPEAVWLYWYNERGLRSKIERVRGVLDYRALLLYDDLGRLMRLSIHDLAVGLLRVSTYTIECQRQSACCST